MGEGARGTSEAAGDCDGGGGASRREGALRDPCSGRRLRCWRANVSVTVAEGRWEPAVCVCEPVIDIIWAPSNSPLETPDPCGSTAHS
jgi:hypothetical protein